MYFGFSGEFENKQSISVGSVDLNSGRRSLPSPTNGRSMAVDANKGKDFTIFERRRVTKSLSISSGEDKREKKNKF